MKSIFRSFVVAGLTLLAGVINADDRVSWVADFNTACGMAAEQRRLVLLHFYNDNCGPCVRIDQNVFSRADVADAVAHNYLAVKVHAGKNPQLATRYHINQWPTDVFVTASGLEVFRTVSPQKPTEYIAVLNQVAAQAGVGMGRPASNPLNQVAQVGSKTQSAFGAATTGMTGAFASADQRVQQTSADAQRAATEAQQKWNATTQQAQTTVSQATATTQNAVNQATTTAAQAGQQAVAAAQQTTGAATTAVQQVEQQAETTKQQWQTTAAQSTPEVSTTAQNLKQQASSLSSSLLDRRSAFVPVETSPAAAATSPAAPPPTVPPATTPSAASTAPTMPSTTATAVVVPPPASQLAPQAERPAASASPAVTSNPWVAAKPPETPPPTPSTTQPAASAASNLTQAYSNATAAATNGMATAAAPTTVQASALLPAQQPQPPAKPAPANPQMIPVSQAPPVGLDGFCPVTLVETMLNHPGDRGAWKKGDRRFGVIHKGRTYLFTSAEQQQKFLQNPDAYAPVLSGCDPVAYAERGQMVDGKRAFGLVTADRRIYLFADEASRNKFEKTPANYTAALQQALARSQSASIYR